MQTVLVAGAGPAGLLFMQYLRNVVGFDGPLLVSEPDAGKRALAASFGAEPIDPRAGHIADAVLERTDGRRAEYLIDASGTAQVFLEMPGLIRKQATVLLYAHGQSGVDIGVLNTIQFREPALVAPVGASGGFDTDGRPIVYREALRLLESGRVAWRRSSRIAIIRSTRCPPRSAARIASPATSKASPSCSPTCRPR